MESFLFVGGLVALLVPISLKNAVQLIAVVCNQPYINSSKLKPLIKQVDHVSGKRTAASGPSNSFKQVDHSTPKALEGSLFFLTIDSRIN
jgi:hypothetical protein